MLACWLSCLWSLMAFELFLSAGRAALCTSRVAQSAAQERVLNAGFASMFLTVDRECDARSRLLGVLIDPFVVALASRGGDNGLASSSKLRKHLAHQTCDIADPEKADDGRWRSHLPDILCLASAAGVTASGRTKRRHNWHEAMCVDPSAAGKLPSWSCRFSTR